MPSVSTIEEPSHIRNDTTNEPSTDATEPAQPVVHSAETLTDLKSRRTCERDRKLARKRLIRNAKLNAQAPWAYSLARPAQDPLRDEYGNIRSARQHMTMHVKGGWHVQLDDDAAAPAESPGEDERNALGEGGDRTMRIEVPLAEVLKPGKPRRRAGSGVGRRTVIALDDYEIPEPQAHEPWEYLELDESEIPQKASYAEVAAGITR